jgi:hypothetical protein
MREFLKSIIYCNILTVIWLKYCQIGVKPQSINQSIILQYLSQCPIKYRNILQHDFSGNIHPWYVEGKVMHTSTEVSKSVDAPKAEVAFFKLV